MRYLETHQRRVTHVITTVPNREGSPIRDGHLRMMCGDEYPTSRTVEVETPRLRMCPRCEVVIARRRAKLAQLSADL